MEFYEVINKRRTIRDFTDEEISDEAIERIIDAGMKAPTNDHMRDWHFIIIKDKNQIAKCINKIPKSFSIDEVNKVLEDWNLNDPCQQEAYKNAIPKQYQMLISASCLIIPLLKQNVDILKPDNLSHLNGFASIWCALENIFLATTSEGYGATLRIPLGDEENHVHEVLNIPDNYLMPCFVAIGKEDISKTRVIQKTISTKSRIHINKW